MERKVKKAQGGNDRERSSSCSRLVLLQVMRSLLWSSCSKAGDGYAKPILDLFGVVVVLKGKTKRLMSL
jgi:hypothetical protein